MFHWWNEPGEWVGPAGLVLGVLTVARGASSRDLWAFRRDTRSNHHESIALQRDTLHETRLLREGQTEQNTQLRALTQGQVEQNTQLRAFLQGQTERTALLREMCLPFAAGDPRQWARRRRVR